LFLQLALNPNRGSHQWLAVAGNAGLLRILRVANVGSKALSHLQMELDEGSIDG